MLKKMSGVSAFVARWLCLGIIFILAACSAIPIEGETNQIKPRQLVVPMLFVTNRGVEALAHETIFTQERGELSYGFVQTKVDTDDVLDTKYSTWQRWTANHNKDLEALQWCHSFWLSQPCLYKSPQFDSPKEALLYIHGTGRSFDKAAEHMANLVVEIDFTGVPILYSWPASNNRAGYFSARSNTEWSAPYLASIITDLLNSEQFESVHIVAHSLGNRLLLSALQRLSKVERENSHNIDNIVLLAPDVDTDLFVRDYLPLLHQFDANKSLYVSSKDIPLKISTWLNGQDRLGDASARVFKQINTIDVSQVHTHFSAHAAYRKSKFVQEDLHQLLVKKLQPEQRNQLSKQVTEFGYFWQLQK